MIRSLLLFLLAFVLSALLWPVGIGYALFMAKDKAKYFAWFAQGIDQTGNRAMEHAFNKWLIQDDGYKFGNIDETISSALGKNKRDGTLTPPGKWLDKVLDKIDPGHSINSIGH